MANFLAKLFGTKYDRDLKALKPIAAYVAEAFADVQKLSNDELRGKTAQFREVIHQAIKEDEDRINEIKQSLEEHYDMPVSEKESLYKEMEHLEKKSYDTTQKVLDDLLPEAFAVMKETARRFKENETIEVTATDLDREIAAYRECVTIEGDKAIYQTSWMAGGNLIRWDMCHFDVQLMGGAVLHQGKIAEMATGEGKTLVATLPVYLNALPGKGVHVVTVNDYLAKRDSEWMGLLYEFLGLTVDCIDKHQPNTPERKKAYDADITYGTNNEFGFDYLRDNMARNLTELVQRPHNFAIVDEVDSVLIDDARTPLIISGPTPRGDQQEFDRYKPIVEKLYNAQKTLIQEILPVAKRLVTENPNIKPEEFGAQQLLRCQRGLPKNKALIKFLSEPNIKNILQRTEGFYMAEQNRNMFIIDNDLTQLDDDINEKIHKSNKKFDDFNYALSQYNALDEASQKTVIEELRKEASDTRKNCEHILADTKKQLTQTVDMEDSGKFAKSLANIACLYGNLAIIDRVLDKENADNFTDYRDMMTATLTAEHSSCQHLDRKKELAEMLKALSSISEPTSTPHFKC